MGAEGNSQDTGAADAALVAQLRRIHVIAWIAAAIFMAATAVFTAWYSDRVIARGLAERASDAERDVLAIAGIVDRLFHEFAAIPRVLSSNFELRAIVTRYNAQEPGFAGLPQEQRMARLNNDPQVRHQSDRLTLIRSELNYALVYIANVQGVLVASSESDRGQSFLGLKVDDREYFKNAMAGREGHMFALARISPDPVLFFSTPIRGEDGPIGVAAVTQRTSVVGAMLPAGHGSVLIVDKAGMVVATSNPSFYLRHVSKSAGGAPDARALHEIYGRQTLSRLNMAQPVRRLHEREWTIDGRHYLATKAALTIPAYSLLLLSPMDRLDEIRQLHYAAGGMAAIFVFLVALLGNRRAEYLARRRHSELTTAALNESLRKLNTQKDHYLGIAAHDLRNPLSSIRGLSEIMLETPLEPEQQREFLGTIRRTSDEMLGMVNDLLDVAVIESGKLELRYKDQDVARLIDRRARLLEPNASGKQIQLVINAPGPQMAKIDAARFSQVIDNLVSNAIKFSPPGTTIQVTLHSDDGSFTFSVRDEGPGIPEAEKKLLFRSFQKLSARPTGGEKSTGLGLAIVKRIVDAHGGTIDVESGAGGGTCFTVIVPLKPPQGAGV